MTKSQDSVLCNRVSSFFYTFHINLSRPCVLSLLFIICLLAVHLYQAMPAAGETEDRQPYIISRGDHLRISVVSFEKELLAVAVVRPDGMITYPVVGDVEAAGLTIAQLATTISNRLAELDFYKDPQVTVQLEKTRQEIVYIFGDVVNPGKKEFPRPVNIAEALAAAGGFKDTADLASARIIKKRKEVIPIDLGLLLADQDTIKRDLLADELVLEDGDVLMIPSTLEVERISVIGHVNNPGQYPVKANSNLVEALALAGGPINLTADLENIRIIRSDGDVAVVDATRLWEGVNEEGIPEIYYVQPGDSLVVPKKEGRINIFGEVKNQGQYNIDDEIGVLDALAMAGVDRDSNLKKLRIVRSNGEQFDFDATRIWKDQYAEADVKILPGDTIFVPKVFRIDWNLVNVAMLALSWLYTVIRE